MQPVDRRAAIHAQAPARPSFDVASVKVNKPIRIERPQLQLQANGLVTATNFPLEMDKMLKAGNETPKSFAQKLVQLING